MNALALLVLRRTIRGVIYMGSPGDPRGRPVKPLSLSSCASWAHLPNKLVSPKSSSQVCFWRSPNEDEGRGEVPAMLKWVNDPACLCGSSGSIPGPGRWVKDPLVPQLWCRSQFRLGYDLWLRNFHMPWVWLKRKKADESQLT